MSKQFYETRSLFRSYINYTSPYSFDQWNSLPEDHKAAALYVQYFDQIILAWFKAKLPTATDEEGVETVCQYLLKNVPIIEKYPKRFTPAYIYKVAYNCIACINYGQKSFDKLKLEMSDVVDMGDGTLGSLFDHIDDTKSKIDIEDKYDRARFWALIESDEDVKTVVDNILNSKKFPRNFKEDRKEEALKKLREVLSEYKDIFYI